MIIAIDGASGSGKGTLAQNLVKKFGFHYLDTGALFRAVGLCVIKDNSINDDNFNEKAIYHAQNLDFVFTNDFKVLLNNEDVSNIVRSPEVGQTASKVSAIPEVRLALDDFQQTFAQTNSKKGGAVLDGRDIGTFIAPNAEVKFFLECPAEARAQRRVDQLAEINQTASFDEILKGIIERDARDTNREVRPLKAAKDAIIINTFDNNISQVLDNASKYIEKISL